MSDKEITFKLTEDESCNEGLIFGPAAYDLILEDSLRKALQNPNTTNGRGRMEKLKKKTREALNKTKGE